MVDDQAPAAPAGSSGRRAGLRAAVALVVFVGIIGFVMSRDEGDAYVWIKALHLMAVMAWMAGLFYLPRLFIYHHDVAVGSEASDLFVVMERRLYRIIMNPAMMISWVLGLYLAYRYFGFSGGWLHAKLAGVVAMTACHVYLGRAARAFAAGARPLDGRKWRMINEIPTVLMMVIVVLVIVKPF